MSNESRINYKQTLAFLTIGVGVAPPPTALNGIARRRDGERPLCLLSGSGLNPVAQEAHNSFVHKWDARNLKSR